MSTRLLLMLGILGTWTGRTSAQAGALDLIPANAAAAIVIRHPDELRKKGDEFLNKTELNLGLRPSDALDFVKMFLGINQGFDVQTPSAAVLLRPEEARKMVGPEDLDDSLYIALAYTELDKMAGNFGFANGELKLGTIAKVKAQNRQFGHHVMARGRHIYLANSAAALQRMRNATPLTGELAAAKRQAFGSADILFHVNPTALGDNWNGMVKAIEEEFTKVDASQEKQSMSQFVKTLTLLRFGLIGVRVGDGLGVNFLAEFPKEKDEAVQDFLDSLRARGSASLNGLPERHAVAAQAYAGDSVKNAVFARALFSFLLKNVLETEHITSAADRPTFVGVFDEVWQRLLGSRLGVYLTSDETKLGLFSLVAILDTQDAEKFLVEMRTLAKIADGKLDLTKKTAAATIDIVQLVKDLSDAKYQVRASATTRLRLIGEPAISHLEKAVANPPDLESSRRAQLLIREISAIAAERRKELLSKDAPRHVRPTFAFVAKAETRVGLPVDIVHVKLLDKDQAAIRQMQQLFGPDWDKLRLAVHGNQVVALLGSDVELFDTTLANLKDGKAGLAASKLTEAFGKMQAPQPTAVFHVSVASLLGLVNSRPQTRDITGLTSFALSVPEMGLQLDLFIPAGDIKTIVKNRQLVAGVN